MLSCHICYRRSTPTPKHFPRRLVLRQEQPGLGTLPKEVRNITVGYLCKKCSVKERVRDVIRTSPTKYQKMGWREIWRTVKATA